MQINKEHYTLITKEELTKLNNPECDRCGYTNINMFYNENDKNWGYLVVCENCALELK